MQRNTSYLTDHIGHRVSIMLNGRITRLMCLSCGEELEQYDVDNKTSVAVTVSQDDMRNMHEDTPCEIQQINTFSQDQINNIAENIAETMCEYSYHEYLTFELDRILVSCPGEVCPYCREEHEIEAAEAERKERKLEV